ncbi:LysR substrate-binding domain-containing protein [Streptomyces sp. LP11]|uniref:LysR substrate-binding domain-containing protein n=1 Tax=Streptomyces pyxinicus TaxID=2970331 RepID=A0ABT2B4J2_9ACTN|nr:LysR substrate-binding domain-containing protein [Streptomyces sp. LP11]
MLHGVLAADLHRFRAAHPRVEVTVAELPPTAQLQALRDGTLDIGYCPDLGLRPGDDLEMTLRARTTLSVALRHDHELATAGAVTTSRLAERDLIVFAAREEDETVLARLGPAATGHRARVQVVSGTLGVLALAAAGAGVAVVPAVTERIALPDLVYRPLLGADGPDVVSVSRAEELSGSVKAFVNCLSAPCRPRSEPG